MRIGRKKVESLVGRLTQARVSSFIIDSVNGRLRFGGLAEDNSFLPPFALMHRYRVLFAVGALAALLFVTAVMQRNDRKKTEKLAQQSLLPTEDLLGRWLTKAAHSSFALRAPIPGSRIENSHGQAPAASLPYNHFKKPIKHPAVLAESVSSKPGASTSQSNFPITYESVNIEKLYRTNLSSLSDVELENLYFSLAEQQHIACPKSVRIGDSSDGGWDVCISEPFDMTQSRPCVAFSFGINNVWSYDDTLAEQFGCRVHMFDPSMELSDHQRKQTSWFHRTGLSGRDGEQPNGWKMRTLCGLLEDLGYGNKTVDIVKMDIEYWEWDSLGRAIADGCLSRVKQLLFESHTGLVQGRESDYSQFISTWRSLFQLGYRAWNWHRNPHSMFSEGRSGVERACCYEHYLINTNFFDGNE